MKRATLRWGTAAAVAAILIAAWLLLRGDRPARAPAPPPAPPALPAEAPAPDAPPPATPPAPTGRESYSVSGGIPEFVDRPPAPPEGRRVVLEGKVVGLGDEPVAGATVVLMAGEGFGSDWDVEVATPAFIAEPVAGAPSVFSLMAGETKAGEDGSFRIETVARRRAGLIAWGGAYANTFVPPFSLEQDVRGLVLRMEPAVALSGRVMEAALPDLGHPPGPVAGASVSLLQRGPSGRKVLLRTERTDEEGRFRTWGWTPGTFELAISAEGFVERRVEVRLPADGMDIRLIPARASALAGRVWLPGGAGPAAGARVRARLTPHGPQGTGAWEDDWRSATADAEGRYRIEGFAVSTTPVKGSLMAEAYAGERGLGKAVLHAWSGTSDLDIDLLPAPAAALRVRVVDGTRGSGRGPVAGMRVVARASLEAPASSQWPIRVERVATTDAKGVAEFRGLPAKHVFLVAADDEWEWEVERGGIRGVEEAPSDGPWEQEIEVFPRGRVAGVVLGPSGEPVAGARVEFPQHPDLRFAPAGAITGADGRFLIPFVTCQAPISLRATAAGFLPAASPQVTVVPGSTVEGVVLALPAALALFAGRVVDAEGKPRPEATVFVEPTQYRHGAAPVSVWTGTGGRFRAEVSASVPWTLQASGWGLVSEKIGPIVAGDPVPDLVLRPAGDTR